MNVLNFICCCCACVLTGIFLLMLLSCFCTSLYACFTKKVKGGKLAKILTVIVFGSLCPLVLRLFIMCFEKM